MRSLHSRAAVLFVAAVLSACSKSIETPFTDNPLKSPITLPGRPDPGDGPYCRPAASGKYEQAPIQIADKGEKDGHVFVLGGGCILRPMREVWAVLHNAETLHWDRSDVESLSRLPSDQVSFLLSIKYGAGPSIFRQKWTMEYYHALLDGTVAAPARVLIQYKKVSGTSYITYWQGAIEIQALTPEVTSFAMRDEVEAAQTGLEETQGSVRDVLNKARTLPPNWDYFPK